MTDPIRADLERFVATHTMYLPPDMDSYIDPEHQGEDRQMLRVFYDACMSEGGTADEIHLRGLRAVLAHWGRPAAPEPVSEPEVGEWVDSLALRAAADQVIEEPWMRSQGEVHEEAQTQSDPLGFKLLLKLLQQGGGADKPLRPCSGDPADQ